MALKLVSAIGRALASFAGTGLLAWTGTAFAGRTITRGLGTHVTNGSGVSGDPVIAFGNSGAALTDPAADRILGWDDSATGVEIIWFAAGTGLVFSTTNLTVDQSFSPTWTGTHRFDLAINLVSGQITFPATQAASAGANTLDDYEEGTFNPTFSAATPPTSVTYTTQSGEYEKIGRNVQFRVRLIVNSKGSGGVGQIIIGGLPFAASGNWILPCGRYGGVTLPSSGVGMWGLTSGTTYVLGTNTNTAGADINWADISATGIDHFCMGVFRV